MRLQHPFASFTPSRQKRGFVLLSVLSIAAFVVLTVLGAPLQTEYAPLGIVSFEFAKTPLQAQQILESWGRTGEMYAALNLGLDYLFLVLYSSSLALACALIAGTPTHRTLFYGAGVLLSWAQFGAAGLDALENVALIKVLLGSRHSVWPELAWRCALLKFIIVFAGLVYIVGGAAFILTPKYLSGKDSYGEP